MSIRPVDMQVIIPKTTEISKQNQEQTYKGEIQQQEFAQQMEKKIMQHQQQVVNTNKSEYAVNDEGRNKNQNQGNQAKKKKNKNEKDKKSNISDSNSIIDIRI
ncbi:MAG TPA: hypothetical protein PLL17_08080 [Defluviitaleaceae bacterium]|mgnify:CR=1 FL=1|nr:hypothetical protein [Candidatus Epulonipiscium sp.]HOQ16481.1 hypothetical protein [Defluviitaleaceae bacterium]HPT75257.1 hypothetical protein [Defluviitaleaceae bacterium]HQD51066.1 hypothetical protein [Defluviitaleaceae bacterium]